MFINGIKAKRKYTGGERSIYIADGFILKVDPEGTIYHQCNVEAYLWNKVILDPCDRKHFVPLIAWGDGWVAQKFVKFKRGRRPTWTWKLIESLMLKYNITDAIWNGEMDVPCNWGILQDGTPVIYDWGV